MNQTQISENDCGNSQFYKCVIEKAHCINCNSFFPKLLKKGDWIKHKCWSCRELKNIKVQYVWSGSQIEGRCQECLDFDKAISPLMEDFVWACETHHEKSQDEITAIEEKALNKIIKLPKEQLKEFLRRMNSGIER